MSGKLFFLSVSVEEQPVVLLLHSIIFARFNRGERGDLMKSVVFLSGSIEA